MCKGKRKKNIYLGIYDDGPYDTYIDTTGIAALAR